MEKTRIIKIGKKKWLSIIFLFVTVYPLAAQRLTRIKDYCGLYFRSMSDLLQQKQEELAFYQFRPGQVVASIGAQCCHWEAAFAATGDSLQFYLQDIDSAYFNARQADFSWHYYDSLRGRPMTSSYQLVLGNEQSTGLPSGRFDKILIINSFHEFTAPAAMLADIRDKLKPEGLLYIDESVPRKPGQLHGICKHPMLTPEELNAVLTENGFTPVGNLDLFFRKGKPMRKIYAFKKKASPG